MTKISLDDELFFLRKDEKICSYAPKGWVSGKRSIRHAGEFVLYLKTQYFVGMPSVQLLDAGTRYYYYLGLRTNVAKSKVMVPIETLLELIALGLQVINANIISNRLRNWSKYYKWTKLAVLFGNAI